MVLSFAGHSSPGSVELRAVAGFTSHADEQCTETKDDCCALPGPKQFVKIT